MAIVQKSSTSKLTLILPLQRYNKYFLIDSVECRGNEDSTSFPSIQFSSLTKNNAQATIRSANSIISKKIRRFAFVRAIHSYAECAVY